MLKSLFGIASDVVKVAVAPIEIAADATRAVTKPLADAAQEVVKEVKAAAQDKTGR